MDLAQIKNICDDDKFEVEDIVAQYKAKVKIGKPFKISFEGNTGTWYCQDFDKFGHPIGRPSNVVFSFEEYLFRFLD